MNNTAAGPSGSGKQHAPTAETEEVQHFDCVATSSGLTNPLLSPCPAGRRQSTTDDDEVDDYGEELDGASPVPSDLHLRGSTPVGGPIWPWASGRSSNSFGARAAAVASLMTKGGGQLTGAHCGMEGAESTSESEPPRKRLSVPGTFAHAIVAAQFPGEKPLQPGVQIPDEEMDDYHDEEVDYEEDQDGVDAAFAGQYGDYGDYYDDESDYGSG